MVLLGLRAFVAVCVIGALFACGAGEPARPPNSAAAGGGEAFGRMKATLEGGWIASTEKGPIHVRYRAISNGSAIAESFVGVSGRETMTVFYRDGARFLLTHYCAQGNQATLQATEVADRRVVFALRDSTDVTNMTAGQSVLVRLGLEWSEAGVLMTETYRQPDGRLETTKFQMVRESSVVPRP